MSSLLESNESIIWSGKPKKNAYLLPALGGIPFALFFSIFLYLMLTLTKPSGLEEMFLPLMLVCWIIGLIVVPPVWKLKTYSKVNYVITNQRIIIKSGLNNVWFTKLENIKEILVKFGVVDKICGTCKIYPITPKYPYAPQRFRYTRFRRTGGLYNLKKVYNLVDKKYEEVTQYEIYTKSLTQPYFEGLDKSSHVEELLRDYAFRVSTT
jgi:hypothetical protein